MQGYWIWGLTGLSLVGTVFNIHKKREGFYLWA